MKLYWNMPIRIQEAALSLYARKLEKVYFGPQYEEWKQFLKGWESMSPSYIAEWKNQQLQHIVEIAAKQVPYYRKIWEENLWKKIKSEEDLHLLPALGKQSIRLNERSFIVENQNPRSLWVEKTSGSTGTSLKIYWPMSMLSKWWAINEVMIRYAANVAQEIPRSMVGTRPIIRGDTNQPPFWRFNRRWRQLYLSSYHISRKNIKDYIGAIRKHESKWMTGLPSSIAAIAKNALEEGMEPYPLLSVIVSGDTLLDGMRISIENFFKCKCFNHYGQSEGVAMAMECSYGRLHIIPFLGIIEILREDGMPCEPEEVGEIVGTSLLNDAMPLIRYRTGDYAAWAKEKDCPCGNNNPVITKLEGRTDDYLVTLDGRKISRLSSAFQRNPTIHSAQIVQDRPGHAFLLIRPAEGYLTSHATAVYNDILERIGKFELEVVEVSEIPKTLRGKTALVVRLKDRPQMEDIYKNLIDIS